MVEVYFDWAGPCHAMTRCYIIMTVVTASCVMLSRYIKKIKMELGEDKDLKFVMACADYIPPLQPFRGSCKPVWLFVAAGNTKNICSASKNISPWPRRGCVGDGRS